MGAFLRFVGILDQLTQKVSKGDGQGEIRQISSCHENSLRGGDAADLGGVMLSFRALKLVLKWVQEDFYRKMHKSPFISCLMGLN